jgi:hypothetical protein
MISRNDRGQILPVFCILFAVILFFVAANFQRSRLQIDKIQRQKEADALALRIANEQARALNSVAALNEGLTVLLHRAYLYAVGTTAICAIAARELFLGSFGRACRSLVKDADPFYDAISDMGEKIAEWQDEIVRWGGKAPKDMTSFTWNPWATVLAVKRISFVGEGEGSRRLLIHRGGQEEYKKRGANSEEAGMANGGDVRSCRTQQLDRSQFASLKNIRVNKDIGESLVLHFMSSMGDPYNTEEVPDKQTMQIGPTNYTFTGATLVRCTSLKSLMGGGLRFSLPRPYVIEPNFWKDQHVTLVVKSHKRPTDINRLFEKKNKQNKYSISPFVTYAQAKVIGGNSDNFEDMDFEAVLSKVTGADHD